MRRPNRHPRLLGVTLIEIMIVIVIIALAGSGVAYSVGALARTRLRAGTMRVMAAARYARHRALTQGRTVRVVLDLDADELGIEESDAAVVLSRRSGDDEDEEVPEAVDPWTAAEALLATPDEPALGASQFHAITDEDGDPIARFALQGIDGVRIGRFAVDHEPSVRERGRVAFYFFPNGTGERSYTELVDPRNNVMVVEIEPISGRGRVHGPEFDITDIESRRPRDPG